MHREPELGKIALRQDAVKKPKVALVPQQQLADRLLRLDADGVVPLLLRNLSQLDGELAEHDLEVRLHLDQVVQLLLGQVPPADEVVAQLLQVLHDVPAEATATRSPLMKNSFFE